MSALTERSELSPRQDESLLNRNSAGISTPHRHDVLCERGKMANNHPGNIYYRLLIGEHRRAYVQEKINSSSTIVNAIRSLTPAGRFLKKRGSFWYEVGETQALEKASQCLREGAPELRGILQPQRDELPVVQKQTLDTTLPSRTTNITPGIISCNSQTPQITTDNGSGQKHSNIERTSMPAYSEPRTPTGRDSPQRHSLISSQFGSQMEIEPEDCKMVYDSFRSPCDSLVHSQLSDRVSLHKGCSEEIPSRVHKLCRTANKETANKDIESCFDRRAMFAFFCSKAAKQSLICSNNMLSLQSADSSQRRLSKSSTGTSWLRDFKMMEQSIGNDTFRHLQNASHQSLLSDNVSMISEQDWQEEGGGADFRRYIDGSEDRLLAAEVERIEPLPFEDLGPA